MSSLRPKQLVHAARAMATAASPHADTLVQGGFPTDTLQQLGAAAAAVEAVVAERGNTKVRRAGATQAMTQELARAREAVNMLNAVISKQFAGDPAFLAGWRVARRVVLKGSVQVPAAVSGAGAPPVAATAGGSAPQVATAPAVT